MNDALTSSHSHHGTHTEAPMSQRLGIGEYSFSPMLDNAVDAVEAYGRDKPLSLALWAMGIGFVLGWKLKIW